jgi:hypothetical protein
MRDPVLHPYKTFHKTVGLGTFISPKNDHSFLHNTLRFKNNFVFYNLFKFLCTSKIQEKETADRAGADNVQAPAPIARGRGGELWTMMHLDRLEP